MYRSIHIYIHIYLDTLIWARDGVEATVGVPEYTYIYRERDR